MGINNVLQAHSVGAGAGQDPANYTNSQQTTTESGGLLPTPPLLGTADGATELPSLTIDAATMQRWTFLGVLIADALLLAIFVALVM